MPISEYGVWKGHIQSWTLPEDGAHATLQLEDGSGIRFSAAVNLIPSSTELELFCWLHRRQNECLPLDGLSNLDHGANVRPGDQIPALDLLQGISVRLDDAIVASHSRADGPLCILNGFDRIVSDAIDHKAVVYIFGSVGDGHLNNIHMNQGSRDDFRQENGTCQDGGIIIQYAADHWDAIFIAFASQAWITDESGHPAGPTLQNARGTSSGSESGRPSSDSTEDRMDLQLTESNSNACGIETTRPRDSELFEDSKDQPEIRKRAMQCRSLFEKCQGCSALCVDDWADLMSAKFSWWSLGIGAEKSGHSSLDYRVRTRDDVRSALLNLLDSLTISLRQCIVIGTLTFITNAYLIEMVTETGPQARQDDPENGNFDGTEFGHTQRETAPATEMSSELEDSELGEQMYYVSTNLEFLSKLSAKIRKSGTKFRHQRVDNLIKPADLEAFRAYLLNIVLMGYTRTHLLNWFLYRQMTTERQIWTKIRIIMRTYFFGRLNSIQDRLIQANLIRRNRFDRYYEIFRRKTKAQKETDAPGKADTAGDATEDPTRGSRNKQPVAPSPSQESKSVGQKQEPPAPDSELKNVRSVNSSLPATGIAPSFVVPQNPRQHDSKSISTRASQGVMKQDYPKCPVLEGTESWWCPYCAQPLDASYTGFNNRRWRGHVAEDLSPYVCIYENCDKADVMYATSEEWKKHLKHSHSAPRWICDICWLNSDNPRKFEFDRKQDWDSHIIIEHDGEFDEDDLMDLAEASQRIAVPPVACPLCHEDTPLLQPDTDEHISEHLHSFALQSLPWHTVGVQDDETEAARGSDVATLTSLQRDQQKSIEGSISGSMQSDCDSRYQDHGNDPNIALGRMTEGQAMEATSQYRDESIQADDDLPAETTTMVPDTDTDWSYVPRCGEVIPAFERPETPPIILSTVPFRRDPDFVGRDQLLDLIGEKTSVPGSKLALIGLDGVGKSAVAIEYSYRIRSKSPETWVFRISANNPGRLENSLREIADHVKIPGRHDPHANTLELVWLWLHSTKDKWVLIMDNMEDDWFIPQPQSPGNRIQADKAVDVLTRLLSEELPQGSHGSIIITTRSAQVASQIVKPMNLIVVEPLHMFEALELFQTKLDLPKPNPAAMQLVEALEFLPLAIVQAAAYIEEHRQREKEFVVLLRRADKAHSP